MALDCTLEVNALKTNFGSGMCGGAPGGIRTPNPQIRSLMLYPVELRARPVEISRLRHSAQGFLAMDRMCGASGT